MARIAKPPRARLSKTRPRPRRRRQTRRARAARRHLRRRHDHLPRPAQAPVQACRAAFTAPTYSRFVCLTCAAVLTAGHHTVLNLRRPRGPAAPGAPSSYQRVFSHRRWSRWRLARLLLTWVITQLLPDGPIYLAGDDTGDEHRGNKVYGKGRHRDPVRSAHTHTAFRGGHQGVVLAVWGRFPFARRRWAWPVLVARYGPEGVNRPQGRGHQTPPPLRRQRWRLRRRRFPDRHFVGAADGHYATHDLARLAAR